MIVQTYHPPVQAGVAGKAQGNMREMQAMGERRPGFVRYVLAGLALIFTSNLVLALDPSPRPEWLPGINLAGGEFNPPRDRLWTDYVYPSPSEIDYFTGKGFRLFRIPFLAKRVLDAAGNPTGDLEVIRQLVAHARARGALVVLDLHQYGSVAAGLVGRDPGASEELAAIWGKLATRFRGEPNVVFGLMNEPHQQSAAEWLSGANLAIGAIREAGATQLILVPGSYWDGAHSWVSSGNAEVMLGVRDPRQNYAYEVHQYLDRNHSGTSPDAIQGAGAARLLQFTRWARENKRRGFLGEFGWADNPRAHAEGEALVAHMSGNRDVWLGWSYWAAGSWWGEYMYTLSPKNGQDRAQMNVLSKYLR